MRTIMPRLTRCFGSNACSPVPGAAKRFSASLVTLLLFAAAIVFSPTPASAQGNCLQDEYAAAGHRQTLNCTANDVRVAKAINIRGLDGTPLSSCNAGVPVSIIADFLVQTTANSTRSNIGLYFDTGDVTEQDNALSGSCSDNIIPPDDGLDTCSAATSNGVHCGSTHYDELDASPDNCGDSSSTDPTVCLDENNNVVRCPAPPGGSTWPGTQIVTVEIDNLPCTAPTGTTQLVLPNCTSWQVPGKTTLCEASGPYYPYPIDNADHPEAIPGSPSKCNCDTIPLGITVQSPSVSVAKACDTGSGYSSSCTLTPEGGSVTYKVTITNGSNFGDVVVDQICDNRYGTVFRDSSAPSGLAACATGTVGTIDSTTCAATLTVGSSPVSCTFDVTQAEDTTIQDIVSVSGHGASAGTFGPTSSSQVTVTSGEATTSGTITKSYADTTNVCATVRYNVDVKNTSASGTDETLTVSALSDSAFGDITKWTDTGNSLVLGTTCGVPAGESGLGSLSGVTASSSNGGELPYTMAVNGGDYTCQFDAKFCSAPSSIVTTAGVCDSGTCTQGKTGTCSSDTDCDVTCTGIHHTNNVSATLTGDENETITLTPGGLTVNECINPQ